LLSAESAVEWLSFTSASTVQEDNEREQSQEFLDEIGQQLPADALAAAKTRGSARALEELAAEVLTIGPILQN
jgi:hypothetical protein